MGFYDAWQKEGHVELFDIWSRAPLSVLRDRFERCNEVKLLNAALGDRTAAFSLLEVGCATGMFSRYFSARYPKASYIGCDISKVAIERAQEKYPNPGRFVLTGEDLKDVAGMKPDVVFCRDVILHQPEPFMFLRRLYDLAQKLVILRLRTRDVGATELDPEKSCQLNYGIWAPYMVLNCQELLMEIKQFSPLPERIRLAKHYMVLGGQHARYLPKDCYLKETGTAESALLIERGVGGGPCIVEDVSAPENLGIGIWSRVLFKLFR